jgi:hypothetical protein
MRMASFPESTRSLANRHLKPGHIYFAVQSALDLRRTGCLKKQRDGLAQIVSCFVYGVALAGYVKFGTQRNIPVPLAFDQSCKLMLDFHGTFVASESKMAILP